MVKKSGFWKFITVVVCLGIIAALGLSWFNKPLAPALALDIPEKSAEKSVKVAPFSQASNCGETGAIVFMFASYDSGDWSLPHGSDMIRYFRADFSNLTIDEVALPRDLWVNTPVLKDKNIEKYKLGKVFDYEPFVPLKDQKEVIIQSTTNLAQTVYDNFATTPDKYVTLDAKLFAQMIDTIGGITVNNEYAFTTENYTFSPGQIQLDGSKASEYTRWFNDDDLEVKRFKRQEAVLKAVWEKMTKPENIVKLPELNKQFQDSYVTDLSPAQISSLFCLVEKVTIEKMKAQDVTPAMFTTGGPDDSFIPDVEEIKTLMKTVLFPVK